MTPTALSGLGLHLSNASLTYDGAPLFENLDLPLHAGEWVCLLGPSGVGKSTLLELLAGLAPPHASGDILCDDGQPLAGRVAYMAQRDLLLPWLTVLDNVLLGARLRGERPDRDRAADLLAAVGLSDAAGKRPDALSGGMKQRAALARTLMEDRPVVLMDEPFSALDPLTRLRLQDLSARLLAGRTVFLVTHDPLEALRLGDRLLVMTGRPARLQPALIPLGDRPRDVSNPQLLEQQAELLRRLAEDAP